MHREDSHVTAETEISDAAISPGTPRMLGGRQGQILPQVFQGSGPADTVHLDLWPPEMRRNILLLL